MQLLYNISVLMCLFKTWWLVCDLTITDVAVMFVSPCLGGCQGRIWKASESEDMRGCGNKKEEEKE